MLKRGGMSTGNNYFIANPDCLLRGLQTEDIIDGRRRGGDNWWLKQVVRPLPGKLLPTVSDC
jgi:hypothetical protein